MSARATDSAGNTVEYRVIESLQPGDQIAGGWKPWAVVERVEIDSSLEGARARIHYTTHGPTEWYPVGQIVPVVIGEEPS